MDDDDTVPSSLRDAADPRLEPGAAERIAAGAWGRASVLRAAAPSPFRTLRRAGWAAAAAVLVAAAAVALRGTDPVFAVEGDPVNVQRGGAWVETRSVSFDATVDVPAGVRVLRWTDGGLLRPSPGSRFRLVRGGSPAQAIRVEFERGGGDVEGGSFVVATREVEVERDPSALSLSISFTLDATDGAPRVEVGSGRECGIIPLHSEVDRLAGGQSVQFITHVEFSRRS